MFEVLVLKELCQSTKPNNPNTQGSQVRTKLAVRILHKKARPLTNLFRHGTTSQFQCDDFSRNQVDQEFVRRNMLTPLWHIFICIPGATHFLECLFNWIHAEGNGVFACDHVDLLIGLACLSSCSLCWF